MLTSLLPKQSNNKQYSRPKKKQNQEKQKPDISNLTNELEEGKYYTISLDSEKGASSDTTSTSPRLIFVPVSLSGTAGNQRTQHRNIRRKISLLTILYLLEKQVSPTCNEIHLRNS